jgi:hypothetical protein
MSDTIWQEFEKNEYGISRGGLSGQYGLMPPELYLKKMERTCMYEREDQLDDFFRSTLKDRTLDNASLAQDLPRETQDQLRSDVMNVRHSAARTEAEPIHPDLFFGLTERDARGYHDSGPDFKESVEHSKSRTKYIDFLTDHGSDWTIPEGRRSEMRAITDMRKTIGAAKERYKIFDTSFDSRPNPWSGMKTAPASCIPKTAMDGTILNLNDAQEVGQRKDNTKLKTDLIRVGYRQTGDHIFKVAQYGLISKRERRSNIHSSQYRNKPSHKFEVMPSEVKNRLYNDIVKEVSRRKFVDTSDLEYNLNESVIAKNNIKKLASDLSAIQLSTTRSAEVSELDYKSSNIKKVRFHDPLDHDAVVVDEDIFKKIQENKNIKVVNRTDMLANRNVVTNDGKIKLRGDEVKTVVYKRNHSMPIEQLPTKMEHKWYDTDFTPMYKNNYDYSIGTDKRMIQSGQGVDPHGDAVFDRYSKGRGQHWQAREEIDDNLFNYDPINDGTTILPSHKPMVGRSRM